MNKVVIIGAGSSMFTRKLIGDLLSFDDMQMDEFSLVDINTEKLAVMEKVVLKLCKQFGKEVKVTITDNRRDVLKDAKYVINTIGVGGVEAYRKDLEIPDKYGLSQCIGDIIGPGGMFRFLRAYPELLRICKDMEDLCPDAFLFNYTNPMAPLCLALSNQTSIKLFGFCHNVQSTAQQLSNYLQVDESRISYWASGINHMDWFLEYKVDGKDAYPKLFEISQTEEEIIKLADYEKDYASLGVRLVDLVRFKIMHNFGRYPSESPFHMSEYVPYFRKNEKAIKDLQVDNRWWFAHECAADSYFEELKDMLAKDAEIPCAKTFEYAPEIIHANITGKPFRANLNVKNTGLISNLPENSVVEVPCYTDSEGIHPCYVGELPYALAALNKTNINMHVGMAMAANEKKTQLIYDAVKMDPLTGAILTLDQINDMVAEMIEANAEYLTDFE
ncbi:MAG: alpha-galactosidase [Spirochaetales bacterium]|uniref:Alpha-galactosidase n=1 Tax=Candidatus Thalassospirochaeta sargassi TaxID=3119039 RepID=A0AAJ1IKR0_9SPIO|nr:alpha-galactosidase [Spirochaetales bacterium]